MGNKKERKDVVKNSQERDRYLAARESAKPKEFWETIDAWPLYVGTKNLKRYLFLAELLDRVRDVPGDVAEFGAWKGATTSFFAKALSNTNKTAHAFDNFAGFDAQVQTEKDLRSAYKGNLDELKIMLAVNGLTGAVEFYVGDICKTVLDFNAKLSLVYIDCDVYEPCIAALRRCHNLLSPGGLIVFDEWNDPAWPGETQAATEFLNVHGAHYIQEATPVEQPSLVLVKR